jgi:fumarate reductase flavoprotein subunit
MYSLRMTIIRDAIPSFEFSMPVVVIGAGACGLTAALAARDAGVEVLVLERDKRPWGSTSMSLGAVCGVNSAAQKAAGINDSVDTFISDVMDKTEGRADPLLTRLVGEHSGEVLDWLSSEHQVPLLLDFKWVGLGHSHPRLHIPPGRNGEELLALLSNACARAGVEIMTEARVVALYADSTDRVVGVRIQRPDGIEDLGCEQLILATCGFGGNHEWVAQHIPEMARAQYFGHEGNQGDGILWGLELGAAVGDMSAYQGLGTLADPQQVVVPHPLMIEGGFLVNSRGQRFTHELANISGMCVPVLEQPGGTAWVIFDRKRHDTCLAHSVEQQQLVEVGAIKEASSWAELETLCQLPAGSLTAENAHIDAARKNATADRLGRDFSGLASLQPPFCAVKVTGALFHTQGGLQVNDEAAVVRADGRRLPNLYAGGGAARGVSGPDVTGYLPAMGLCMAITLGAIAGRSAARAACAVE